MGLRPFMTRAEGHRRAKTAKTDFGPLLIHISFGRNLSLPLTLSDLRCRSVLLAPVAGSCGGRDDVTGDLRRRWRDGVAFSPV
jgi:hypothetical protein